MKFMFLLIGLQSALALACSTGFLANSAEKIFVKSYDWHLGSGQIVVNKRNVEKHAFLMKDSDVDHKWISKYGSVTINQHGREFPLGGINEAGLAVEIMWLDETVYPEPDSRPSVNELQWIQYQLDNFGSVDEMLENIHKIRVAAIYAPVHYLVCDEAGDCATVEHLRGETIVHSTPMPSTALTNSSYEDSAHYLSQHVGFGGSQSFKSGMQSLDRFTRISKRIQSFDPTVHSAVDYGFYLLDGNKVGGHTKFNLVYEIKNRKLHVRTLLAPAIKSVDANQFSFDCRTPVDTHDINALSEGDISAHFVPYNYQDNLASIEKGMVGIGENLPEGSIERTARFPDSTRCMTQ